MKVDKADMPKIIVLGVLVAVFIGWGAYSMIGRRAAASSPPPAQSVREAAESDSAAKPKTPPAPKVEPAKPVQVAATPAAQPQPTKDPFTPRVSDAPVIAGALPRIPMIPRNSNLAMLPPFKPGISVRPIDDGGSCGITPFGAAPALDPQFVLTGVINGATNVAIIRAGDERHIVREGQYINGKYLVKSIGHDRVVLTTGTRSINLRLGGASNAS